MFKRIYLDHASTTPVDPKVARAVLPYLKKHFANPASIYREGVEAKKELAKARKEVADVLHAHSDEIIFTGSGTEANNLILLGIFEKAKQAGIVRPHVITLSIEHPSVLEVCYEIERRGGEVSYLPVNESGIVDPKSVRDALKENTVLVSVMFANNEIGTIQPIREIAKVVRHFKKEKRENEKNKEKSFGPYFHTDASQAANYCDLNLELLGVDCLTLDSSKIYAPKGTGMAYIKRGIEIVPITQGGGQEKGLRSGTENLFGIVGFATALTLCEKLKTQESDRLTKLRDYGILRIITDHPKARLNGDQNERLPNNINICFPGIDADFAVLQLDARNISCSSVTSCKNLTTDSSSYVIEAIGKENHKQDCDKSSLRITMGRTTEKKDIDKLLKALKEIIIN